MLTLLGIEAPRLIRPKTDRSAHDLARSRASRHKRADFSKAPERALRLAHWLAFGLAVGRATRAAACALSEPQASLTHAVLLALLPDAIEPSPLQLARLRRASARPSG